MTWEVLITDNEGWWEIVDADAPHFTEAARIALDDVVGRGFMRDALEVVGINRRNHAI